MEEEYPALVFSNRRRRRANMSVSISTPQGFQFRNWGHNVGAVDTPDAIQEVISSGLTRCGPTCGCWNWVDES
jgi:hypothetical protein